MPGRAERSLLSYHRAVDGEDEFIRGTLHWRCFCTLSSAFHRCPGAGTVAIYQDFPPVEQISPMLSLPGTDIVVIGHKPSISTTLNASATSRRRMGSVVNGPTMLSNLPIRYRSVL